MFLERPGGMGLQAVPERVLELAAPGAGDGERPGAGQEAALDEVADGRSGHGAGTGFHAVLAEQGVDAGIGCRACAAEQAGRAAAFSVPVRYSSQVWMRVRITCSRRHWRPAASTGTGRVAGRCAGSRSGRGSGGAALSDGEGQRETDQGVNDGCVENDADQPGRYGQPGVGLGEPQDLDLGPASPAASAPAESDPFMTTTQRLIK